MCGSVQYGLVLLSSFIKQSHNMAAQTSPSLRSIIQTSLTEETLSCTKVNIQNCSELQGTKRCEVQHIKCVMASYFEKHK